MAWQISLFLRDTPSRAKWFPKCTSRKVCAHESGGGGGGGGGEEGRERECASRVGCACLRVRACARTGRVHLPPRPPPLPTLPPHPAHLWEVSLQPLHSGLLDGVLAGGDHHEVAGAAQAPQRARRPRDDFNPSSKVAGLEELVDQVVAVLLRALPHLAAGWGGAGRGGLREGGWGGWVGGGEAAAVAHAHAPHAATALACSLHSTPPHPPLYPRTCTTAPPPPPPPPRPSPPPPPPPPPPHAHPAHEHPPLQSHRPSSR